MLMVKVGFHFGYCVEDCVWVLGCGRYVHAWSDVVVSWTAKILVVVGAKKLVCMVELGSLVMFIWVRRASMSPIS